MTEDRNYVNRCPDCLGSVVHAYEAHTGDLMALDDTFGVPTFSLIMGQRAHVAIPARVYVRHTCPAASGASAGSRSTAAPPDADRAGG